MRDYKFDTPCEKDSNNKHYWKRIGIRSRHRFLTVIWICSQCDKYIEEKIKETEIL